MASFCARSCVLLLAMAALFTPLAAQTNVDIERYVRDWTASVSVSPRVFATYWVEPNVNGLVRPVMLVLWRGRPLWYGVGLRSVNSVSASPPSNFVWTHLSTYGGKQFRVQAEPATGRAYVQGVQLDLARANVVLVDYVDEAQGPTVIDTFHIDAHIPRKAAPDVLIPLFKSSPALVSFLQCRATAPPPYDQQPKTSLCKKVKG
jgi:hypothetical protein